jgi:hypothetical protein
MEMGEEDVGVDLVDMVWPVMKTVKLLEGSQRPKKQRQTRRIFAVGRRRRSSWRRMVRDEAAGRRAWSPGGVLVDEDAEVSENRRWPMMRYRRASRGAGAPGQRARGRSEAGRRECGGGQGSR